MKILFLILSLLTITSHLSAQAPQEQLRLCDKGMHFHDTGLYPEAIEIYNQAYQIDSLSELAATLLYEIALSNHQLKRFDEAEKYTRLSILKDPEMISSYMLLGTIQDDTKRPNESLETYFSAIDKLKDSDNNNLTGALYLNIAITYFRYNYFAKAEKFLHDVAMSDFYEVLFSYVTFDIYPESEKWIMQNKQSAQDFEEWMKSYSE